MSPSKTHPQLKAGAVLHYLIAEVGENSGDLLPKTLAQTTTNQSGGSGLCTPNF